MEGLDAEHVADALRIAYDAFAQKFRIGFRDADDLIRLFRDSLNTSSCFSATAEGRLLGVLTFQTKESEFYDLRLTSLFIRFSPLRAILILFGLMLLEENAAQDEFIAESLAVSSDTRGMGVGTSLMQRAEQKAISMGKRRMALSVVGENSGAIRLYERLGYRKTKTMRGFFVRLATGSTEAHRMEKPLTVTTNSGG